MSSIRPDIVHDRENKAFTQSQIKMLLFIFLLQGIKSDCYLNKWKDPIHIHADEVVQVGWKNN